MCRLSSFLEAHTRGRDGRNTHVPQHARASQPSSQRKSSTRVPRFFRSCLFRLPATSIGSRCRCSSCHLLDCCLGESECPSSLHLLCSCTGLGHVDCRRLFWGRAYNRSCSFRRRVNDLVILAFATPWASCTTLRTCCHNSSILGSYLFCTFCVDCLNQGGVVVPVAYVLSWWRGYNAISLGNLIWYQCSCLGMFTYGVRREPNW